MTRYTDVVAVMTFGREEYKMFPVTHLDARKAPEVIRYRGVTYRFASERAHLVKGWYPWVNISWRNPFMLFRWLVLRLNRTVGLLIYVEPDKDASVANPAAALKPVEPVHISMKDPDKIFEVASPGFMKGIILSPVLKRYQSKKQFQRGMSNRVMIVIIIVLVVGVAALMMATGRL